MISSNQSSPTSLRISSIKYTASPSDDGQIGGQIQEESDWFFDSLLKKAMGFDPADQLHVEKYIRRATNKKNKATNSNSSNWRGGEIKKKKVTKKELADRLSNISHRLRELTKQEELSIDIENTPNKITSRDQGLFLFSEECPGNSTQKKTYDECVFYSSKKDANVNHPALRVTCFSGVTRVTKTQTRPVDSFSKWGGSKYDRIIKGKICDINTSLRNMLCLTESASTNPFNIFNSTCSSILQTVEARASPIPHSYPIN